MLLAATFSGEGNFYSPVILITYILLIAWFIVWSFKILGKKLLIYSIIGIVLCCVLTVGSYNIYQYYINSIPTVNEQDLILSDYEPFKERTKAVILHEESMLKITDSLPRIDGATALYPLYAAFVQATYPQKEYNLRESEVRGGTTPQAYERLISGEVDLIFCAQPSKEQIEDAASKGKVFKMTSIGREAFVFFVNKKNPVNEISSAQIRDIYSGKITNWKELGGEDDAIRAFQRPEGSGSQTMLRHIMGNQPLMMPIQENRVGGMGEIVERTSVYKNFNNAIGYSFLLFATRMVQNDEIKLLKVDAIYPDKKSIENNTYPFTGDFYAITTDTQNKNVEKLIKWILSPQGQYLVEETGYTPILASH